DQRTGKVDDRIDLMFTDDLGNQRTVADIADIKPRLGRHGPVEARGQPVEHNHVLTMVQKLPDHVASDITGSTSNKNAHSESPDVGFVVDGGRNRFETRKIT